ncbi:uncharacterized protein BO96DRAFT_442335 [Aspergillus niger CBS 101883]|uniref:Uncharacterized protein n=2 Tax=Aspergillus TaxID=5052 RepID=A0A370PRC0_ASPPH|nr:uncharacterized protein BO96DRAFT_442335 [Aspergillus niger CBS 101883]PYH60364.1 hypothetical protein BO96DRAFT_442335 [Aspergillus niger CBS 101883]RDK44757.1 hypothetical protein M752DRAFT_290829 [Aspergillus phoenicis ATCC 13157]
MIAKLDDSRSLIKSSSAFEHRKKDQQCHDFEQEGKTIDRRQVATEDLLTSLLELLSELLSLKACSRQANVQDAYCSFVLLSLLNMSEQSI